MRFSELSPRRRVQIVHAMTALAAVTVACGFFVAGASAKVVADQLTHKRFSITLPLTSGAKAASSAGAACATDCTPLIYHGGPVQHAERDYLFFWLPSGYSFPAGYESGLQTWLNGVAAADGTSGNPFSVNTLYYDTSGPGGADSYVPYAVQNAGTIVDTDPYPASGCSDSDAGGTAQPVCLTDAQIETELSSYVTANSLPTGAGVEYFVLTPSGVGSCFDSSSSSCSYTAYCGYHSYMGSGSTQIVYADMPWAYQVPGCDVNQAFGAGYPNSGGIDPVISVFSHELSETMTDPNLNAWYDSSGNEIGDKCAYTYGAGGYGSLSGLNRNATGYWNVPLAGGDYLMQTEYDQRDGNCAVGLTNTWTGAATLSTGWSQAGSWAGALAPAGGLDVLVFPRLASGACAPALAACYTSDNDVSGLSAHAITIDDGVGYSISGDPLTLGSGGISASTSSSSPAASALNAPITLGASQTWTVAGAPGGGGGLDLPGSVSGSGDSLQINLSSRAALGLGSSDEVGPVTVSGAGSGDTGAGAAQNGTLTASELNGTDGNSVALSDVALVTAGSATSGPLTSTGASVQVGQAGAGTLSVDGGLSLDSASELKLFIAGSGSTAGSDYSQISATGTVSLGGALELAAGSGGCPALPDGQVDTLITTTGSLSGTFSGTPNGAVVTLPCGSGAPTLKINYTGNAVIATAMSSAPSVLTAPAITGTPEPGQTLTQVQGTWSNSPTGVVDQWERCDAAGANCSPIAGDTTQQYTATSSDVGGTIRVEEVATNSTGATAAWSAPVWIIATPAGGQGSPPPSATPPSPVASASAGATAAGASATSSAGAADIRSALRKVLALAGKTWRVRQLRAHGIYALSVRVPGAGVVVVSWSLAPVKRFSSRRLRRGGAPGLVALGRAGAAPSGAFPLKIRLTELGRWLLARRGSLTLILKATFTPAGARAVTMARSLTVRK